jgi:hypothetical protein
MMLIFKIEDTVCKIDDNYSLECDGRKENEIKQIWENVLSETKPSSPCPIDEMHTIMENLGAEIVKYEEEFNSELVY